ncbi:MAG: methyl-accepting chemotaxis protein [Desulforegulaceae bacterium]|nr:methyl-accepting chemotaxis protein [Desulforegulaceae bacterium]
MNLENLSIGKKIAVIGIIPLVILFFSQSFNINLKLKEMKILNNMKDNIQMQHVSSQLIGHLQKERGRTAVFLNGGAKIDSVQKLRKETDSVFESWETARSNCKIERSKAFHETASLQTKLNQIRNKYNTQNLDLQPNQIEEYTQVINNLLEMQSEAANAKTTGGFGKIMTSLLVLEIAKENAGLLRANVSSILAKNTAIPEDKFSHIITLNAATNTNLDSPALALSPEIEKELETNKTSREWAETTRIFNEVLLKAGTGNFRISPDTFWRPVSKKIDDIGKIVQKSLDDIDLRIDTAIKQMKVEIIRAFVVTGLTLIITSLIIFFVIINIVRNINNIKKSMDEIARGEGDLTKRLPVKGSDELAELAKTFNEFAENMRKMIAEIAESSQILSDSTTQLSSIAAETAKGADESSSSSQNVAMAAKEMNDSAITMSDSMERAANNLNSVASAMEEMSATISEIASNTAEANAQSEDAAEKAKGFSEIMEELGLAATQIGEVTETINDISEQTNLLALNATIEAARAGEAGRGFAVVANEIKELANQTSSATRNISTQISGIQEASQRAETDMEVIVKSIYNVNEIVSAIAAAIEEQSSAVNEVSSNLSQSSEYVEDSNSQSQSMSALSGEIASAINSVSGAVEQIKNGSYETLETVEKQSSITEKIQDQMKKFKV